MNATGTQTSSAESNTSGTQTRNENTSETQTQTPRRPTVEQRSFVLPGMPAGLPGGLPPGFGGIAGIPMPGMPPPIDRHLPCSSRYFFQEQQRQARNRSRLQGAEGQQVLYAKENILRIHSETIEYFFSDLKSLVTRKDF